MTHRDVGNLGDPHLGVGFQAEGQDGDADEEHGDNSDHLQVKK